MTIADFAPLGSARAGDSGPKSSSSAASPILNLAAHIVLSRATELAREGRYEDAECLLEALLPAGLPTPALDLLARIRAQQGRLAEAKALWLQMSQVNPGDTGARAALDRIDKMEARKTLRGPSALLGRPDDKRSSSDTETAITKRPADTSEQLRARVPGAVFQKLADQVVVTFEFSLFSGPDAQLEHRAKLVLSTLGWQLEPYVGKIAIEVVGQPDALPQGADELPRDVSAIGMARAGAVFNHLIDTTKLQARMFTLRTGENFLWADNTDSPDGNTPSPAILLRISHTDQQHDAV